MARPTKFSVDLCATVEQFKRRRTTKKACADALGITQQTWCNWAKVYPEFAKVEGDWHQPWRWKRFVLTESRMPNI